MNGTTVLLTAIGYVSFLFLIAWWGDGPGRRFLSGRSRAFVYALSLAVYCTSWTYYGSVGLASQHGLDFLPIYIGPILVIGLGAPRLASLARAQNVTTVADFVSARYGRGLCPPAGQLGERRCPSHSGPAFAGLRQNPFRRTVRCSDLALLPTVVRANARCEGRRRSQR